MWLPSISGNPGSAVTCIYYFYLFLICLLKISPLYGRFVNLWTEVMKPKQTFAYFDSKFAARSPSRRRYIFLRNSKRKHISGQVIGSSSDSGSGSNVSICMSKQLAGETMNSHEYSGPFWSHRTDPKHASSILGGNLNTIFSRASPLAAWLKEKFHIEFFIVGCLGTSL